MIRSYKNINLLCFNLSNNYQIFLNDAKNEINYKNKNVNCFHHFKTSSNINNTEKNQISYLNEVFYSYLFQIEEKFKDNDNSLIFERNSSKKKKKTLKMKDKKKVKRNKNQKLVKLVDSSRIKQLNSSKDNNVKVFPVIYTRVFKVNSENVLESFLKKDNRNITTRDYYSLITLTGSKKFQELQEKIKNQCNLNYEDVKSFAFYREPLKHFISGLVESHFRSACDTHLTDDTSLKALFCIENIRIENLMNEQKLRTILRSLLSCNINEYKRYLKDIIHISPQSYSLLYWKPSFVGYLENFTVHWKELEGYLNQTIEYDSQHKHITEMDPFQVKSTFTTLFEKDISYLRMICRLLIIDYICLNFELPKHCEDMLDSNGNYVPFFVPHSRVVTPKVHFNQVHQRNVSLRSNPIQGKQLEMEFKAKKRLYYQKLRGTSI